MKKEVRGLERSEVCLCVHEKEKVIPSYCSQESYEAGRNDAVKGREVGEKSH